jgi:XTP/dITP diphosphohydrolase
MGNTLVIATGNPGKMQELRKILPKSFNFLGLTELGFTGEIPETGNSLEANALQKARFIHSRYHCDCLADDSGLEVKALSGAPGVWSARFAGEPPDPAANNRKLLHALEGVTDRSARFRSILALILDDGEWLFEGMVNGYITEKPQGKGGFGYDPVFVPDGYQQTFAEMDPDLKNRISHRSEAVRKLSAFLEALPGKK